MSSIRKGSLARRYTNRDLVVFDCPSTLFRYDFTFLMHLGYFL